MKTRNQLITEMCLILRPDYHTILAVEDNDFGIGLTPIEQEKIRSTMEKILDDVIIPNLPSLSDEIHKSNL